MGDGGEILPQRTQGTHRERRENCREKAQEAQKLRGILTTDGAGWTRINQG